MTLRLRPHHLLCVLTYGGKGYSPGFTRNFDEVIARLAAGQEVEIVQGPDDICRPISAEEDAHCQRESVRERDRLAAQDLSALLGVAIENGARFRLSSRLTARLRAAYRSGGIRRACLGCEWKPLCDKTAQGGFQGASLGARPA